jgi:hypothetical protein
MDRLVALVTGALVEKLLSSDQVWDLLSTLAARRAERAAAVDGRLASLEREAETAEEKLKRLYKLIEDGVAEADDLLKDRIAILKAGRDRAKEALNRARCGVRAKGDVSQEAVEKSRPRRSRLFCRFSLTDMRKCSSRRWRPDLQPGTSPRTTIWAAAPFR